MVIDTVIIKASYDMVAREYAMAYAVRKLADDVKKGKELQTFKISRFIDDDGWDFLKFNFPVCRNLSSADLMVIYSALNGFDTFVVGNAERERRDAVIADTLGLKNIHSVPELPVHLEQCDCLEARRTLSFTNTQDRGFRALPKGDPHRLVLEMAGDQPLLYNTFRHALDLSRPEVDFAINLNAVSLMKRLVPSFRRNGYDRAWTSDGRSVELKENNNFAENYVSVRKNRKLFAFLYGNRNGGRYAKIAKALWAVGPSRLFTRLPRILDVSLPLRAYFKGRRNLERAIDHDTLKKVFNLAASPSILEDRVHVDATNDDIFSCWDMDGLNNDFLGYSFLFARNRDNLAAIMPHSEELYMVDEALGKAGKSAGIMTEREFRDKYDCLAVRVGVHLQDPNYLRELGIDDDTIDRIRAMGLDMSLRDRVITEPEMIFDIEEHLRENYVASHEADKERYDQEKFAA